MTRRVAKPSTVLAVLSLVALAGACGQSTTANPPSSAGGVDLIKPGC